MAPEEISFATQDGGVVFADSYGSGDRAIVLAHGVRFNKESWRSEATHLAGAGFRVLAIDFRGYGKSRGGPNARAGFDDMDIDVLAAVRYARETGARRVAVIGASMGGFASANAAANSKPGEIDRLVLLAHAPIEHPEEIIGAKLFATSEGDPITPRVREQYEKAPSPKELLILEGSAHAQFLFTTDQRDRLLNEMLRFISDTGAGGEAKPAMRQ
jgi:alpha-beta hydrolase superfamily lysophospholipase